MVVLPRGAGAADAGGPGGVSSGAGSLGFLNIV